jgi:response regulator RpfG family c-di-GMP phosphodiesterase
MREGVRPPADMKNRVLLVDDDVVVLATHQRILRGAFEVDTASDGLAALNELDTHGSYAVVVVDMNMPRMSGLELLVEMQKRSPHTVRIMLTSMSDQETAANAVNSGHVFRFLKKPCRPDLFIGAVRDAVAQHTLMTHERALLEQTFSGIVQLLTGVLATAEPESFGDGDKLRERARRIGQALKLPSTWELETAAMLLRLGVATIPQHVRDKLRTHEPLKPAESELVARIPEIGARIVEYIPRLAPVAEIIRHQGASFKGSVAAADGIGKIEAPLAARILHALSDLQILEESGLETEAALLRIRQQGGSYDPEVLKKIEVFYARSGANSDVEVEERMVEDLVSGLVLAADAVSDECVPLIAAGTTLTPVLVERLRNFAELGRVRQPVLVVSPTSTRVEEVASA